ncbi:MFS transporter [Marinicrinis sediminis]|uniref:MFS transporter n=1 Tax=Marinicrinis sediminis TaxID=1652465 RepID=A0ABW5RDZ7_9BACL
MKERKIKWSLFAIYMSLVVVVLAFTGGLNIASFQQKYKESLVSGYAVAGQESVRKIEYAVKYGKPLSNFYGMDEVLASTKELNETIEETRLVLPDGTIRYTDAGKTTGTSLPAELAERLKDETGTDEVLSAELAGKYHIYLPVKDRSQADIGYVELVFDESVVTTRTNAYLWKLVRYLAIVASIAVIVGLLFVLRVRLLDEAGRIRKKRIFVSILVSLSMMQIVFGYLNYHLFDQAYQDITRESMVQTSQIVKKDIDSVLQKGVPLDQLYEIEPYLQQTMKTVPVIADIQLLTDVGQNPTFEQTDAEGSLAITLTSDADGQQGTLIFSRSEAYINGKLRDIVLDTLTVLVTSFIFMAEITLLVMLFMTRSSNRSTRGGVPNVRKGEVASSGEAGAGHAAAVIRPISFLLFTAIFMSTSFIPMVMREFDTSHYGLSPEVVLGLPISMEMLMAGLATIVAGFLIDRKGWMGVCYGGLLLLLFGTFLSATAWSGVWFIVARGLVGAGYGLTLMALRGCVNAARHEEERSQGVSALFSGMYAGINVGVVVGAMLADRIGFSNVFLTALFLISFVVMISYPMLRVMPRQAEASAAATDSSQADTRSRWKVAQFLSNRNIVLFFLLIIMPVAICSMFLDYYFPVFAQSIGVSSSNVGRAFLLNGLCIVYLGPFLSQFFRKTLGVEKSILLCGITISAAIFVFALQGTLWAAFVAVILLGLADSFGLVAMNNYFLKLKATQSIGTGKALGFYGNIRKVGQMLGPMVFGLAAIWGLKGIGFIGFVFLLGVLIFFIYSRSSTIPQQRSSGTSQSG